ncbi:Sec-independent protein translocase protein TatB [Achromobacter xylosoxidans]|uniref:Sec-independent protein translocase protein TatB n=1 Tax=Alcaligenes xylosoxydans xylosoxydans TaxID=85698 RepID=A0A109XX14_ALCXX|nr:Sec-independent protein translocase protein TatB [Achromobacter xylosoxidans]AMG37718.1 twin-arginine translocase subunit TatB [Achromobacter xylosoxidans]
MFDVSLTELMVIGVVALIVIGPERLPKVARTVGHLLGRAQRYVNDVKSDIQREIELDELRKFKSEMETAAQDVHQSLNDTHNALQEPVQQFRAELDEVAREASGKPALTAGAETTAPADPLAAPANTAAPAPAANPLMTPHAAQPAEPPRIIAPPNPNLSLDLDPPAAAPAAQPAPAPQPAPTPAPAADAPAASDNPPAAKPATPPGTAT